MTVPQTRAEIKGWCPGAHRPMMSGDGLVVRVRPWLSELSTAQVLGLCDAARRFGSGTLDLTSRANIQIRGVAEADHAALIDALEALGLLDADPSMETRRNIVVAHDWQAGGLTHRLAQALTSRLPDLPDMPAKVGFAVDTGTCAELAAASADFRLERGVEEILILRADGAELGRPVMPGTAMDALSQLCQWFVQTGGRDAGRMSRHLKTNALPADWQQVAPRPPGPLPEPGPNAMGRILGAPFGAMDAAALADLVSQSGATALRFLPGRLFLLLGASDHPAEGFVTTPDDPLLNVDACPGAPLCPQAQARTRDVACALAPQLPSGTTLHISGCAKGCARPRGADLTFVGEAGRFNLVRGGAPWEEPSIRGLTPDQLPQHTERT